MHGENGLMGMKNEKLLEKKLESMAIVKVKMM